MDGHGTKGVETLPKISISWVRCTGPDLLSAGPCSEKNVGPFNCCGRPYFFLEKYWRLFLVITVCVSAVNTPQKLAPFFGHHSFHSGIAHFSGMQKFAAPFVGAPFCFVGAPVRPNMLNMPKSAADGARTLQTTDRQNTTDDRLIYDDIIANVTILSLIYYSDKKCDSKWCL